MIAACKEFYKKHRELCLYVLFGGLTTAVDWSVSFLLYGIHLNVHVADVIAWICAVLFAFVTNRRFVFQSTRHRRSAVIGELVAFASGRVLTLLLQELIVFLLYDLAGWNPYYVKILAAVFVVLANYFISKFLVFRKKKR